MFQHLVSNAVKAILVSAMAILFGHCHLGCKPADVPPVVAETSYTTELLACVEKYETRADVDQCRRGVDELFGVTKDAGKD